MCLLFTLKDSPWEKKTVCDKANEWKCKQLNNNLVRSIQKFFGTWTKNLLLHSKLYQKQKTKEEKQTMCEEERNVKCCKENT